MLPVLYPGRAGQAGVVPANVAIVVVLGILLLPKQASRANSGVISQVLLIIVAEVPPPPPVPLLAVTAQQQFVSWVPVAEFGVYTLVSVTPVQVIDAPRPV